MVRLFHLVFVVLGLGLLSGCSFRGDFHKVAIDYNELVADTANELTLLNILRARSRYPLHFTSISQLRGNAKASISLGLPFTVPASGPATVDPSVSGGVESSPSFDVAVLNGEKFQRGILQPIGPELLDYYISQGWPQELIASLFIERIEILENGRVVGSIENDPGCPGDATNCSSANADFRDLLGKYRLEFRKIGGKNTPLLDYADLMEGSTLSEVSVLDGKGFDLGVNAAGKKVIERVGSSKTVFALNRLHNMVDKDLEANGITFDGEGDSFTLFTGQSVQFDSQGLSGNADPLAKSDDNISIQKEGGLKRQVTLRMVTRSVQGAIYFLGEYSRLDNPYPVINGQPLLTLSRASSAHAIVSAKLDGQRFAITADDARSSRAMQVLTIIQQIVNLQKSADELPRTGTISVVP